MRRRATLTQIVARPIGHGMGHECQCDCHGIGVQ